MDLKILTLKAVYKAFQEVQPEIIKAIEAAKASGITRKKAEKIVERMAIQHGSKDKGNKLVLLVEYIYTNQQLN